MPPGSDFNCPGKARGEETSKAVTRKRTHRRRAQRGSAHIQMFTSSALTTSVMMIMNTASKHDGLSDQTRTSDIAKAETP